MKFDTPLQKEIVDYLNSREDLFFHGYTGTHFYKTWERGKDKFIVTSKRPHGDKDSISAEIYIYSNRYEENNKYGVEFKIDMYMWGYSSDETVFQGWAENLEEFKIILKAVGL